MKLTTPADGANAERKSIRRFVQRNMRHNGTINAMTLLQFINTRTERYQKKAGGLGRNRK